MYRATTLREFSNEFKHPVYPLEKEFKGQLRVCVYIYIIYVYIQTTDQKIPIDFQIVYRILDIYWINYEL